MYRNPLESFKYNTLAVVIIVLGGALLLWLVLRYAFSVTSGLLESRPPI